MVIIQYEVNNEYIPNSNSNNEYVCVCGETTTGHEINLKLLFTLTTGYIIYSFSKNNAFPQTMMLLTYKAALVYTKMNRAYNKLITYFDNMIKRNNKHITNNNDNNDDESESSSTDSYTDYEIRVIKNGIKCEQFETMKIFKKSNYLGNPNDYCDSQDEESQSQSSTNESCDVCDVSDSQEDDENDADTGAHHDVKLTTHAPNEDLFIMKHNKQNNTIRFIPYDFIMQTLFSENGKNYRGNYNKLNKNYTRLYRHFTENDYSVLPNDLVISNMGMIVCSLELKGKTYDIDISFPYNFNVVGNVILDYTFLSWYMLKEYDIEHFAADCEYTLRCISNGVTTYKLGKSSGLLVNLNDYEIIIV
jgi:hypothetical protein